MADFSDVFMKARFDYGDWNDEVQRLAPGWPDVDRPPDDVEALLRALEARDAAADQMRDALKPKR